MITKTILLQLVFLPYLMSASAQSELIGTVPSSDNISVLDLSMGTLNSIIDLTDSAYNFGESTYNPVDNTYFFSKTDGIYEVNVDAEQVIQIFNVTLKSIEYDISTNSLFGFSQKGDSFTLSRLNLVDGFLSTVASIPAITEVLNAEGTYDQENKRLFILTNLGITAIDIYTGRVIESFLPDNLSFQLRHLEYSSDGDCLYASYWNGINQIFCKIDLKTKELFNLSILDDVNFISLGESTFNPVDNVVYIETDVGVLEIDADNGIVLRSYIGQDFGNFEAIYSLEQTDQELAIPTLSQWGIIIFSIVLLITGVLTLNTYSAIEIEKSY